MVAASAAHYTPRRAVPVLRRAGSSIWAGFPEYSSDSVALDLACDAVSTLVRNVPLPAMP